MAAQFGSSDGDGQALMITDALNIVKLESVEWTVEWTTV